MFRRLPLPVLLGLILLPVAASAGPGAAGGFDAPQPALDLTQPDQAAIAGLAPGEDLAIAGKRAATIDATCTAEAVRYGSCRTTGQNDRPGPLSGGHLAATSDAGEVGMAAGFMALEGVAALVEGE